MIRRIESINKVRECPDDREEYCIMTITPHWNYRDKIIIKIEGRTYTFFIEDIQKAMENCRNSHGL